MTPASAPSSILSEGVGSRARASSAAVSGRAAPGASRAHAPARNQGAGEHQGRKGGAGFATVLAAAQGDDRAGSAQQSMPAVTVPRRGARLDTEGPTEGGSETRVLDPTAAPAGAPCETPWLLLAFGSGTVVRGGSGEAVTTPDRETWRDDAPVGTDTRDLLTETVTAMTVGVSSPGPSSAPPAGLTAGVPTDGAAGGAVATTTEGGLLAGTGPAGAAHSEGQVTSVLRASVPKESGELLTEGPVVASPPAMSLRGEPDPADTAAPSADDPSIDRPGTVGELHLAERSRVRAVVAGVSGTRAADPPPLADVQMAPAPGTSPATAHAATRLAHALAHPGSAGDAVRADSLRSLTSEVLASAPGSGQPAARAADAWLQMTQTGVGPSRTARDADEAVPFGLAAAATAPVVPVVHHSSPSATATVEPLAQSVGEQVLHQVVSSLKMQWKDGIGEAKLHLRPDALGAVSVSLRVEAGAVTAVVRADSPQVQEWVVQHQQTLRQQMEAAGLRLDDLVVTPDDQRQGNGRKDAPPENRRRRASATPASDVSTFEQLL